MAIPSLLRARRSANRPTEQTQQVVLFGLREYWFALPMEVVKRVESLNFSSGVLDTASELAVPQLVVPRQAVSEQAVSGQAVSGQAGFFDNQPLPLISAAQKIFPESLEALNGKTARLNPVPSDCFLIVLETTIGKIFGLTISSSPKMQRIVLKDSSRFLPRCLEAEDVQCVSKVVTQPDGPQILLLDPDLLCQNV